MVREFNGVPYALLVWTAWNKPDGAPQYRWVAVDEIKRYYSEVKE